MTCDRRTVCRMLAVAVAATAAGCGPDPKEGVPNPELGPANQTPAPKRGGVPGADAKKGSKAN